MTSDFISIDESSRGYAVVAGLFGRYARALEIHAGQYCNGEKLHDVVSKILGAGEDLKNDLWCDAETITHWVTRKLEQSPGEQQKAREAVGAVSVCANELTNVIAALRELPRTYTELNREYYFRDRYPDEKPEPEDKPIQEDGSDPIGEVRPARRAHNAVRNRTSADSQSSSAPKGYLHFLYEGDPVKAFFDTERAWSWSDRDRLATLEKRLLAWREVSTSLARELETKHKIALKKKATKRGAPADEWSKRAICLLACCWKERLTNAKLVAPKRSRSKIPHAQLFKEFAAVTFFAIKFPHRKSGDFKRQIAEVLSGVAKVKCEDL